MRGAALTGAPLPENVLLFALPSYATVSQRAHGSFQMCAAALTQVVLLPMRSPDGFTACVTVQQPCSAAVTLLVVLEFHQALHCIPFEIQCIPFDMQDKQCTAASSTAHMCRQLTGMHFRARSAAAVRLLHAKTTTGVDCECALAQVCAPYSALQGYKLKVKLTPGTQKKGKGGRQVRSLPPGALCGFWRCSTAPSACPKPLRARKRKACICQAHDRVVLNDTGPLGAAVSKDLLYGMPCMACHACMAVVILHTAEFAIPGKHFDDAHVLSGCRRPWSC